MEKLTIVACTLLLACQPYHILAGDNSEYIWCVFDYYPAIRKYDQNGQFLEEIRFVSAEIDKSLREIGYLPKPHESMSGLLVLQNAHLAPDGDVLVNIVHHGMVRLAGKDGVTRISRRYQFQTDPPQDEKEGPWLLAQLIGDTIYAYSQWGMIFKQHGQTSPGDYPVFPDAVRDQSVQGM